MKTKIALLLLSLCAALTLSAQTPPTAAPAQTPPKAARPTVLIVTGHPDDWEMSMAGTAWLLRDKYEIHVVIASRGERGLSPEPREETAAIRSQQSVDCCKRLGAELHFMGKMDGEIFADREGVEAIVKLINELDPVMVFTHWPLEKPDHSAVGEMTLHAMWMTHRIDDHELYFFNVQPETLGHFDPDLYVNIDSVVETKRELIRAHKIKDEDEKRLVDASIDVNRMYGRVARCQYAEGFRTFSPPINHRLGKKIHCSLLDL